MGCNELTHDGVDNWPTHGFSEPSSSEANFTKQIGPGPVRQGPPSYKILQCGQQGPASGVSNEYTTLPYPRCGQASIRVGLYTNGAS